MKFFIQRLPIVLAIACSIILTGLLVFLGFRSPDVRRAAEQDLGKPSYVLVNEDAGAGFNGKSYNLGKGFVDLISQDTASRWQTTTRSVAEARFKEGDYDAYVIIPQNFSAKLLSLESPNPERADITYRAKTGQNEVANQVVRRKIGDILNGFNQKIVQMYFSSILGNLAQAQRNVTAIATGQQKIQDTLVSDVQRPFSNLPETFDGVVSVAELLERQNQSWQAEQEDFSARTQQLLEEHGLGIEGREAELEAYTFLQELISRTNQENAQRAVDSQADSDQEAYKGLYDSLYQASQDQIDKFFTAEDGEESGVLAVFKAAAQEFSVRQRSRINDLNGRISDLEGQASATLQLRKEIAQRYFSGEDKTADNVTDDDVKAAIISMSETTEDTAASKLPKGYLSPVNAKVAGIPADETLLLVQHLREEGLITQKQLDLYRNELDIIKKYAADEGISESDKRFAYLHEKQDGSPVSAKYKTAVTIVLGAAREQTLSFRSIQSSAEASGLTLDSAAVAQEIKRCAERELAAQGAHGAAVEVLPRGNDFRIRYTSREGGAPPPVPSRVTVTFSPAMTQQISGPIRKEYHQTEYEWAVDGKIQNRGQVGYYQPRKDLRGKVADYFPDILDQLQPLDQASLSIAELFGSPSRNTLDIAGFSAMLRQPANAGKSIRSLATADSVYYGYARLTDAQKKELIADSLVCAYKAQGTELYRKTDGHYRALNELISGSGGGESGRSFKQIAASMTPPDYFLNEARKLEQWCFTARQNIADSYGAWKENPALSVGIKEYEGSEENEELAVYFDRKAGEGLRRDFGLFAERAREQVQGTKESAAQIESLEKEFESLKSQTEKVGKDTENVLQSTDSIVGDHQEKTAVNKDYATNFNTVMSNATQGGKGSGKVFNFLASPLRIQAKAAGAQESSSLPYFMTIIGTLIAIACSYGLAQTNVRRKLKDAEKISRQSRAWRNMPNLLLFLAVTGVLSAVFTALTFRPADGKTSVSWASFTFFAMFSGILLLTFFWRRFPRTTVYIVGALSGVYLLLTPVLGISIERHSLVEWLFRISPLQNIENGYAAMLSGQAVGLPSLTLLAGAAVLGAFLNLSVPSPSPKKAAR